MRYEIKELGLGGILDQAVALTKNHFGLFLGITAVLQVPFGLISGFLQLAFLPQLMIAPNPEEVAVQPQSPEFLAIVFGLAIVGWLFVVPMTNAAITHAIAQSYLEKPVTIGRAFRRAFGLVLPLIWTGILFNLAMMGGFILCIIPGILCALWFSLYTQVVVVEGLSGFKALNRSRQLMKGNLASMLALGLLLIAIGVGVGAAARFIPQLHARLIAAVLLQAAMTVFSAAAFVVFYFSARCKHENFDLTLLAQSVGADAPVAEPEYGQSEGRIE
jgi:hypothetical protein